jgi:hypothetical protein
LLQLRPGEIARRQNGGRFRESHRPATLGAGAAAGKPALW